MLDYDGLHLIPLFPLLGAATLGLIGRRLDHEKVNLIALSAVFASFIVCCLATYKVAVSGSALQQELYTWISVGRYEVDLTFGFDALTATLMLVVTGVGFLIHLYSTGYMHDEEQYSKYFAYLNLFICAMSILVLGRSLPIMFIGWEGVGLASYLLIGFWYTDESKASAGKKAFIVNRVGDFGFLIGIFALFSLFGTADFVQLKSLVAGAGDVDAVLKSGVFVDWTVRGVLTFAALSLFIGACGKSAQLPLYVWLPDAMAGPTPVSALIHAATMVTAGVYMLARMSFLFQPELIPTAMQTIALVGGLTAVFAATMGLVQNDIKKVLAYSTVSQLGYMFLAAGVGAHIAAMFHVVTHAFFKACLFLGSGAVIHALHGEQDMRKMGGLKTMLPVVYGTFGVSTLAIAGIPPFAGFFSKDAIIAHAFFASKDLGFLASSGLLGILGVLGALLTAFYMARLVALTFFGSLRQKNPEEVEFNLHKPGMEMKVPLLILGGLACLSGFMNLPHVFHLGSFLDNWLGATVQSAELHASAAVEFGLMGGSIAIAAASLWFGYKTYYNGPSEKMNKLATQGAGATAHRVLYNKWYVDELYQIIIVTPLHALGNLAARVVDAIFIDGLFVKLLPSIFVRGSGRALRTLQTGNVQMYATLFVLFAGIIMAWAIL
ncbi:MAG: NADH-quinone oxidoreductase subunit L [Myxococcota bacterium]|nr:NADH-quinone oxidoreductase subunit L [Myxococcota bacterium]